ncbi:hypothetical protein [Pantanalinema sp. GBBB05]
MTNSNGFSLPAPAPDYPISPIFPPAPNSVIDRRFPILRRKTVIPEW